MQYPTGFEMSSSPLIKNAARLGLALAVVAAGAAAYRAYRQRRLYNRTRLTGEHAIDERVIVYANRLEHALIIRGIDRANPVLLFIHGGPGTPDGLLARRFDETSATDGASGADALAEGRSLLDRFVVVRYDQRGTGKTGLGDVSLEALTVEWYVDDAIDIARYLKARFPNQPLVLVGHSWGSFVGLLAAQRAPHLFNAYVGLGQILNIRRSEPESFRDARARAERQGLDHGLHELNPHNFYIRFDDLMKQRSVLFRTGGVFHNKAVVRSLIGAALESPDYSWADIFRVSRMQRRLGRQLYWQMANYDLTALVPSLAIPAFFVCGTSDRLVSNEMIREYVSKLKAPQKGISFITHAGHFMNYEQPAKFANALVEIAETIGIADYSRRATQLHGVIA